MKKSYADMDPVEEIRAVRAEIMDEFKTLDALCEYLNKHYTKAPVAKPKESKKVSRQRKATKHPS
ncbi:MAG: hypothetical protein LBU79_03025 [Planctomycetota bacterium]|jgi:hypothetical protein|nr:hypothetical protein [Planctomycetota bacterium]